MTTMRHWPLFGLRLTTPRLELRLPSLEQLDALADLAAEGIHDPERMPFGVPWTDAEPAMRARSTVQYHWTMWGSWRPEAWMLNLVTVRDGVVVGTQGLEAKDFPVVREVSTGSWLGQRYQGRGLGTEMRAAVLHLAFAGLGADCATSMAYLDNAASLGVSRRLGYTDDGLMLQEIRGRRGTQQRLRLSRERWEKYRTVPVEVEGLEPCLPLFGLA